MAAPSLILLIMQWIRSEAHAEHAAVAEGLRAAAADLLVGGVPLRASGRRRRGETVETVAGEAPRATLVVGATAPSAR